MSIGRWLGWFVPLALVVGFTWWWRADLFRTSVRTNAQKDVAEIVKNYAQALVWLAAGLLFFVYKTFSGQNIVSLSRASDVGSAGGQQRLRPEQPPLHHLHDGEIRHRHESEEDEEGGRERDEPQRRCEGHEGQGHCHRHDE